MRKIITEKKLRKVVNEVVRNVISEMANDNLSFREFASDMKEMGFEYREGEGSCKVFYNPEYGDKSNITVHVHNNNANISGNVIRQAVSVLEQIGWFNHAENRNLFPYDKWGVSPSSVKYDNSAEIIQSEIAQANDMYRNAEVFPVFPQENSVCVLKLNDKEYNLCRSIDDRRPLYSDWFSDYNYDRKTQTIPCLKRENWETCETEAYPILPNGTLDETNMIIENIKKRPILK